METMIIGRMPSGTTIFVTSQDFHEVFAPQGVKKIGEIVIKEAETSFFENDPTMPRPAVIMKETEDDRGGGEETVGGDDSGLGVSGVDAGGSGDPNSVLEDSGQGSEGADRGGVDSNVGSVQRSRRRVANEDGEGK